MKIDQQPLGCAKRIRIVLLMWWRFT